jgi:hypothetical protein
MAHLLSIVPYEPRKIPKPKWTPRAQPKDYKRPPRDRYRYVPDHTASLAANGRSRSNDA